MKWRAGSRIGWPFLSFPCERDAADEDREHHRDRLVGADDFRHRTCSAPLDDELPVHRGCHEGRSDAAKAVEECHHFGHRRHLDADGERSADDRAEDHAAGDPTVVDGAELEERADDGQEHTRGG